MKKYLILALLMGVGAFGQTAKAPTSATTPTAPAAGPSAPAVPTISAEHRAAYFKGQLQLNSAQQAMQQAQKSIQDAVADLAKDCGEKYQPQMGPTGDPICSLKPEPVKPAAKESSAKK